VIDPDEAPEGFRAVVPIIGISCYRCHFQNTCNPYEDKPKCTKSRRKDGQNVIFKKVVE